jgi:hypothetical protein
MAADRAVTPEHVRDVILVDLDRRTGQTGNWNVTLIGEARESWLFKAHTPLAPWPLAVKVFSTAMPAGLPARQHAALRHYHAAMAGRPELTVPVPWGVLPEHRTLIMKWIDAPRLDKLLRRAVRRPERDRLIAAAGRWLRHFHDQGEQRLQPVTDIDLLRPVDTLLGGEGGANARDPVFRAAYGVLRDRVREFADTRIAFITSHGDFSPANLFLDEQRTVGFDFKANAARPAAHDMLHFLVHAKSFTTSPWMLLTSRVDERDLDAFVSGYGALDSGMNERLLTVFRLAEALHSWAYLIDRMRREGMSARRFLRALHLRGIAKDATRRLEQG